MSQDGLEGSCVQSVGEKEIAGLNVMVLKLLKLVADNPKLLEFYSKVKHHYDHYVAHYSERQEPLTQENYRNIRIGLERHLSIAASISNT